MIASAFGRGNWLAVELHRKGFNVQLVDVTNHLGHYLPEDQDGPFGYFASPRWQSLEAETLDSFSPTQVAPHGWSVWPNSGPWEFRGPSSKHRAETLNLQERALHFVQHYNELEIDRKGWIDKLQELDFERRWIASLASDFMTNKSQSANDAFQKSIPAALFENYCTRRPETWSLDRGLKWCADQGVGVLENAEIPDLAIEHRRIQGIEVRGKKSGFVRCHQLIWLLTSSETAFFSSRAFLKLYKGLLMEPEWCWLRYKLEFEDSRELHQLPDEFISINDLSVPWAHENFAIFRRSQEPKKFHVWLRLPYSQRFHSEYLTARIEPLLTVIKERCPRLKGRVIALPLEASSSSKELGAPLFPVFRSANLAHPPGINLANLWFSHPERWPSYSWAPIFSSQTKIISQLRRWWGELSEEQQQKELQL
jgi:hypothetical protein